MGKICEILMFFLKCVQEFVSGLVFGVFLRTILSYFKVQLNFGFNKVKKIKVQDAPFKFRSDEILRLSKRYFFHLIFHHRKTNMLKKL